MSFEDDERKFEEIVQEFQKFYGDGFYENWEGRFLLDEIRCNRKRLSTQVLDSLGSLGETKKVS